MYAKSNRRRIVCMFMLFIILIFTFLITSNSYSQKKSNHKIKEPRNSWSLGLNYGENGFGPFVSIFAPIGKSTDFNASLSFSGISDSREMTRYDMYGNAVVPEKINRLFLMPLSIGIRHEMFRNDIEGNFVPIVNLGIAPAMVFANPYEKGFFEALGYTQVHYAIGGYAGAGISFRQSEDISLNIAFNYYYLPLINGGIQSLRTNTISNVGGLQLTFGLNFLH